MSERTEQLILMLTPEEKALIERVSRDRDQTPMETVIKSIHALEQQYEEEIDDDDVDIEENLRQALRDVKEGRIYYFNTIQELLDSPDEDDE